MPIKVSVLKEARPDEQRVTLVPSLVDELIKLGAAFAMESGAGDAAKLSHPRSLFTDDEEQIRHDG